MVLLSSGVITVDQLTKSTIQIIQAVSNKPMVSSELDENSQKYIHWSNKVFMNDTSKAGSAR